MSKKPFPFKVCELCCSGGDSGGGTGGDIVIDDVMSDTSENAVQNKVIKAYVDGNRTHYSESVLLCDYTHTLDIENWDGEDFGGTFTLDKEVEPDSLKLYINGEYVPTTYVSEDNDYYCFYANEEEGYIFDYSKSQKNISFPPWIEKSNYKLYEEFIQQLDLKYIPKLDENHIPDTVPKMAKYEKEFICEYTYNSADYEGEYFPGIVVNKKLSKDNITVYVNGEKVTDLYFDENGETDGSFFGFYASIIYYNYSEDTIVFYPGLEDGTVVQIYEENFDAIKDSDLSNAIARTQYVDRLVDGKIGDIDTALDSIIALQESFIGGAE